VEPTGNEGTTIELRYNLAALIIYSKKHAIELAMEEEPKEACKHLQSKFQKLQAEPARDTLEWKELLDTAAKMARYEGAHCTGTNTFDLLLEIGDRDVINQYFIESGKCNSIGSSNLKKAKQQFGWEPVLTYLRARGGGGNSTIDILNEHLSDLSSMNNIEKGLLQTILEHEVKIFTSSTSKYDLESECLKLVRLLTAIPILDLQVNYR